jgi:iron complex transport system ATP-binding protein
MQHGVAMMRQLRRAADELGRTVVVVLHDVNFAARYADRICAMKNGRVVHFGHTAEIMTGEILSEVFRTAVQVIDGPDGPLAVYY